MSAELVSAEDVQPRRTWRQWWLAWPKWLRIGFGAMSGLFALHLLLVLRIAVGLRESEDIDRFRRPPRRFRPDPYIGYHHGLKNPPEWLQRHSWLLEGFYGRSSRNVTAIMLDSATEADLEYIGDHFPNLSSLELFHPEITPAGLINLQKCSRLEHLEIKFSDLDDECVEAVAGFKHLESLFLNDGIISPKIQVVLPKIPRLKASQISNFGTCQEAESTTLEVIVRWSDGELSANCAWNWQLVVEVPRDKNGNRIKPFDASDRLEAIRYSVRNWKDNGEYRFYLRVGNVEAEPVKVHIAEGKASTCRLEFQMPVKKADAKK